MDQVKARALNSFPSGFPRGWGRRARMIRWLDRQCHHWRYPGLGLVSKGRKEGKRRSLWTVQLPRSTVSAASTHVHIGACVCTHIHEHVCKHTHAHTDTRTHAHTQQPALNKASIQCHPSHRSRSGFSNPPRSLNTGLRGPGGQ